MKQKNQNGGQSNSSAICQFLGLILRWKVVMNRWKVSFVIPVELNACKNGKERIQSAFPWAKQH